MKFKEININNFRQYYGNVFIDLETNAEKNIVLIGGRNGYGKTNLLLSIVWCLYGDKISQVDLEGFPDEEIEIEVNEHLLKKYGLTIDQVALAVKRDNIELTREEIGEIHKMVNPTGDDVYNWKYQIIANKSCQIDVDKIDYILRDSFHLGIPHSGEFKKLLEDVRLNRTPNNNIELVWDSRLQFDIYSLFATRYRLHKKVYTHHTVKGFEYIIIDIMKKLYRHCLKTKGRPLSEQPDSIVTQFCYNNPENPLAKNLITRNHSKLVGELIIKEKHIDRPVEKLRIILDLFVEEIKIGFVSGNNKNPLENVYYYNKSNENDEPFRVNLTDSSFIIPEKFQERIVRVYRAPESSVDESNKFWKEFKKKYE